MRNLISVILMVFLPLTLASDTQHRFKVYVSVDGDDETTTGLLTSHLKRELRALYEATATELMITVSSPYSLPVEELEI